MSTVLLVVAVFGLVTSTVFTGMLLVAVFGYLRERRTARRQLAQRPGFTPPLTLLKPLDGDEPDLAGRLATFFEQDYPEYEILFCARNENDPGLEVARRVAHRYPGIRSRFFATGEPACINAKAASMELMESRAAYDILVISDSDVRVTPNYLRAVALPFAQREVGAVTCLYRGVAVRGLWARLEAIGMSVEMTSGVLVARMLEGMRFTLGPTMAFRRETIWRMGGFRITADYCADDFVLGHETSRLGEQVALSHHSIDHIVLNSGLKASLRHQVRWMTSTRFSRPRGHFGTALTFSMPFGLLALASAAAIHRPGWGLGLFGWSVLTRLLLSIAAGWGVAGERNLLGLLVLYPVRDLMGFFFWLASYRSNEILWRGRVFRLLQGGKMNAIEARNPMR